MGNPIICIIPDKEKPLNFPSVPDAVAECRRYFMRGGKNTCKVFQDNLIYNIEISEKYIEGTLP